MTLQVDAGPAPEPPPERAGLRISRARLLDRLAALAGIGAIEGTAGAARLALTDEDRHGRDLVVAWMRDLGLEVTVDAIGNVVGVWRQGAEPADAAPVHERQPHRHRAHRRPLRRQLRRAGRPGGHRDPEPGRRHAPPARWPWPFFTNEEGARFAPDMLGSLVYVGGLALEEALDIVGIDGATVGDELDRIGYRGPAPCPGPAPHAFVELHIEQGPVLEEAGITIGAVTGVQGISWQELHDHRPVEPRRHHAHAPPPRRRLRRRPSSPPSFGSWPPTWAPQVGTVGALGLHPNLVNVVAASATLTVDLRNTDDAALAGPSSGWPAFLRRAGRRPKGCTITTRPLARFDPVAFDPGGGRPGGGDGPAAGGDHRCACRRGPATTPRCWPGCAPRP